MKELRTTIIKEMDQRIKAEAEVKLTASSLYRFICECVLKELGYEDWEPYDTLLLDESKKDDHLWVQMGADNQLFIRVNPYSKMDTEDIEDFVETLQREYVKERRREWGILTDCATFILVNAAWSDVNRSAESIVLKVDLMKKDHWKYLLKYFSYYNLFESKNTRYFLEIAKFRMKKVLKSESSFETYKSTLFNFFDFYADSYGYASMNIGHNSPLEAVSYDAFRKFILKKQSKGKLLTENTIKNNYSHISGMLKGLGISNVDFDRDRDLKTKEFDVAVKDKNIDLLSIENMKQAIEYLDDGKFNSNRNVVLFYLFVYMGIERSAALELKWDNFDFERKKYKRNHEEIDMPKSFIKRLKNLRDEISNKSNEMPYVFTTYHNGEYKMPAASTINNVFTKLKDANQAFEGISPQYLRNEVANFLFERGFSLEEICYLMNINIVNILHYISVDKIMQVGKERLQKNIGKHPFYHLLD